MSSKNPKILSKNLDYENPYMKIFHEKVEYPNKKQNDYWVLHRRTEFFSIIIPLFPNNETVLVGQFRIPTENYSWEFPMGGVVGKEPRDVAIQELKEEVGLVAQHIEQIGNYHLANGFSAQQVYVFVATGLEQQEAEPEEFEFLEIKRIPISEVEKMILDGTIKDGPTISAYLYLEKYLQK